ncbi:hypothetical protein AHF37_12197, partial [Paragonimus kellicotti]
MNELCCEVRPSPRQPPFYNPDDDFDDWAFKVRIYLSAVNRKLHSFYILSFLGDAAVKQFRASGVAPESSPEVIWETLQGLFGRTELASVYRERFHARRQQPSESVDSFLRDLRELALKAFPQSSPEERNGQICDRFCLGLSNQGLRGKFLRKPAASLLEAVEKARAYEAVQESMPDTPSVSEPICFAARNSPQPSPLARNCIYCKRFGSRAQKCGHNPPLAVSRVARGRSPLSYSSVSSIICSTNADADKPLTVNGRLDNEAICFLIDTGASCSILNSAVAAQLKCKIVRPEYRHQILTANGTTLQTGSQVVATVQLAKLLY